MKKILIFVISFLVLHNTNIEARMYEPLEVRNFVNSIDANNEKNLTTLTRTLIRPFDNDYNKAQAIAYWIASRITYNSYLYNNGEATKLLRSYKVQSGNELIESRFGICGDYANLFLEMTQKAKISAKKITGYVYSREDRFNKYATSHAWNSFRYKGKDIYVDTTFMSKSAVEIQGRGGNLQQKRSAKEIKKAKSINRYDPYYFDFTYKSEKKLKNKTREEK
ncbi:MAG: transglutaminase-like domain-containing protein [Alphaproteobacteria bacterium]